MLQNNLHVLLQKKNSKTIQQKVIRAVDVGFQQEVPVLKPVLFCASWMTDVAGKNIMKA